MKMKYYALRIIQPIFEGNICQGKQTTVYVAIKDKLDSDILIEFDWAVVYAFQIPSYRFLLYILTKPVTNHIDCFKYSSSVVVE